MSLQFGELTYLNPSFSEHFNNIIEKFIRMTYMRKVSTMEEAVKSINISSVAERHFFKNLFQVTVERIFPGTVLGLVLSEL